MKLGVAIAVAAVFSATAALGGEAGDAAAGKAIFLRTCQNCHSMEVGVNKVGPSLWHVVGRAPASVPGFVYSDAMKANAAAWSPVTLDAYLADPRGDLHGVKMFFKGLPEPKDRADVIAYLRSVD